MKTLVIRSDQEMNALRMALEMHLDFVADTITDEVPYKASQIRELAMLSDEEIENRLKEIHDYVNERVDSYINVKSLLERLA